MRTKHVLMAMALPAMFAACTSEEFMEEQSAAGLSNRPLLSADFSVNVAEPANTRFAWEDENFSWAFEDGDSFGAAVTDPATIGTISNEYMLGNYIFGKGGNGWQTTSQMVVGTYMFYSYEGFQNKSSRDLIPFDLGTQKADLNNAAQAVNDKQLFFSPLYKLEEETSNEPVDLMFYPYWSTAAFRIKNTTGQELEISQIVLKDNVGSEFVVKGEINPKALSDAGLVYAFDKESGKYELSDQIGEGKTYESYDEAMQNANIAKAAADGETTSIALNCGRYALANNATVTAYMAVPAHASKHLNVTIIVVDENGQTKQIDVTEAGGSGAVQCVGISTRAFKRGVTNPVFGMETNNTMKTLVVAGNNLKDADGFYVDNKADLLSILNQNYGDIKIYNMGDLSIDDEIAEAIYKYTGAGIEFINAIRIECTGETILDKTTFAANVVVESGDITFGENVEIEEGLTLNDGVLTLSDGTYNTTDITVEGGELVLAKTGLNVKSIVNKAGTVTLNVADANDKDAYNLSKINLSINPNDDAATGKKVQTVLNINAPLTVDEAFETAQNAIVNNASEITLEAKMTNNGTFNNGNAENDEAQVIGSSEFENAKDAVINNYGTVMPTTLTNAAEATVNNYKWLGMNASSKSTTSTNDGKIVMSAGSRVYVSAGDGEIDNTLQGFIEGGTSNAIVANISADMTNDGVIGSIDGLNKLYLNGGTWTVNTTTSCDEIDLVLNGGTIYVNDAELTVKSLYVANTSTVKGAHADQSKLTVEGTITKAENAELNIEFATVAGRTDVTLPTEAGTYYIDGATTITGTGANEETITLTAFAETSATMVSSVFNALNGNVVVGDNVALTLTVASVSGMNSTTKPDATENPEEAADNAEGVPGLVDALKTVLDNSDGKVSTEGTGSVQAEFTVEFNNSESSVITAIWDAENEGWNVIKIADND